MLLLLVFLLLITSARPSGFVASDSDLVPAANATVSFVATVIATSTADNCRFFTVKMTAFKKENAESSYETFHAVCIMAPEVRWGKLKLPSVNAAIQVMGNASSVLGFYASLIPYRGVDWVWYSWEGKMLLRFATAAVISPGSEVTCRGSIASGGHSNHFGHSTVSQTAV